MIRLLHCCLIALALASVASAFGAAAPRSGAEHQSRAEKLRVVATLPDLADLARAIGGERIDVDTLARPGQNLHAVRVKPSHLVALSRADLFLQVGLSLEHAWVPGLIQTARNREVLPGTDGFVSAGKGFTMIEVPLTLDRGQAVDVHPLGNPHVNLSMNGGLHMAERVRDGLIRVDPAGEADYRAGFEAWKKQHDAARLRWNRIAEAIAAKHGKACLYHREFDYLLGELGLPIAAFLEPRPGLPPTPSHLADVIETVKGERIPVVLTAPWSNNKNCAHVARATGADVLELPVMVGGGEGQMTWIDMMDRSIRLIAEAYGVDIEAALSEPMTVDKQRASQP